MCRVLLIQPPIRDFYLTRKRTLPLGLAGMAASLEEKGFQVHILDALATSKSKPLDLPGELFHLLPFYGRKDISRFSLFHGFRHFGYSFEHIGVQAKKLNPRVVGISSLFTAYGNEAMETARAVKKFCPGVPIVMGGHHPTHFPREVLGEDAVDYVLRGEGEESFPQLVKALVQGKTNLGEIPGIAHVSPRGMVITPPHWIKDLDELPLPRPKASTHYRRRGHENITLVSSRGCPMPCSYCAVSSTSDHGPYRKRNLNHVLNELKTQADFHHNKGQRVGFIDFEDENLTLDKNWCLDLLQGIREMFTHDPVELRAMNGLFPPSLDFEILNAMETSGFKTLNLSLGSADERQLRAFNRPDVRKAHDRILGMARKLGMDAVSYLIAAAPDQRPESSVADLIYLAQRPTIVGLSIFYPAPGSRDWNHCAARNLLPSEFGLTRGSTLPIEDSTSRIQASTLLRLARILNFMKWKIDQGDWDFSPKSKSNAQQDPRTKISNDLLHHFLETGEIQGMDHGGRVYRHTIDPTLTRHFISQLDQIQIMGTKKGPKTLEEFRISDPFGSKNIGLD